jgi:chemotaxis protein CheC
VTGFSDENADALQAIVNQAMGTAAGALTMALGAFVELKVPRLQLLAPHALGEVLFGGAWAERDFVCIRQGFSGQLAGESLMLLQGSSHSQPDEQMLLDVANAVMGACVNAVAEALQETVTFSPPSSLGSRAETEGTVERQLTSSKRAMLVDVDFRLGDRRFDSRVLVFLSEDSVERIDHDLTRLLESLVA